MRLRPRSLPTSRPAARNPARLRVDARLYSRCFPRLRREILSTLGVGLLVLAGMVFRRECWLLLLPLLPMVGPFARRIANVRRHFAGGDVNAAKVIDPKSGLVAAFADLGTHSAAFYPTVRILSLPLAEMAGGPFVSGDDLPAVSVYTGAAGGHKWDGFNPVPAACATSDSGELARIRQAVPEWQWMALNEALFRVPRPYRPGLYPIGDLNLGE